MEILRNWSFARVTLVSAGWVIVALVAFVAWSLLQARYLADMSIGSGGIGVVSVGFNLLLLVILVVPPLILIGLWLAAHWL